MVAVVAVVADTLRVVWQLYPLLLCPLSLISVAGEVRLFWVMVWETHRLGPVEEVLPMGVAEEVIVADADAVEAVAIVEAVVIETWGSQRHPFDDSVA